MTIEASVSVEDVAAADSRQMLTFTLGDEKYGVDILRVQEIRGWSPVTRIPKAPSHVLGVLNLRGSIVPIIDLRRRFGLESVEFTTLTVIIVLSVETASGRREFGLVVDGVSDVVDVRPDDQKPAPDLGGRSDAEFLLGLATIDDQMVMLLDVDSLVSQGLVAAAGDQLAQAAEGSEPAVQSEQADCAGEPQA